ncbi:MAG: hypothetical protein ACF8PN_05385 [Phycisphaerales bacterium]
MSGERLDHPYRILGIDSPSVGPFVLLGLSPDECEPDRVRGALKTQLARVDASPHAGTADADALRLELQVAAEMLLDPTSLAQLRDEFERERRRREPVRYAAPKPKPRRPVAPRGAAPRSTAPAARGRGRLKPAAAKRPTLSPVEKDVIGALVTAGGWNTRARQRIAAVGANYGLDAESLATTVTTAVARWTEPAAGAAAVEEPTDEVPWSEADARAAISATTRTNGAAARARLSAGAPSGPVIPAAPVQRRVVINEEEAAARNLAAAVVTFIVGALAMIPLAIWVVTSFISLGTEGEDIIVSPPAATASTTNGSSAATPSVAPDAATPIDLLVTRMNVAETLTPELLGQFESVVATLAPKWTMLNEDERLAIRSAIVSSLYERGDDEGEAAMLIDRMAPRNLEPRTKSETIHFVWSQAMLGLLASEPKLPAPARSIVTRRAGDAMPRFTPATGASFNEVAAFALDGMIERLVVGIPNLEDPVDPWLGWIESVNASTRGEARIQLLLAASQRLLANGPALEGSDDARQIAMALFDAVDWTRSPAAKRLALGWFDDAWISASDLAVFTAYLVEHSDIPGLEISHVLKSNATAEERALAREDLAAIWALDDTVVDPGDDIGPLWAEVTDWIVRADREIDQATAQTLEDLHTQFARLVVLNESAALFGANRPDDAAYALEQIESRYAQAIVDVGGPVSTPASNTIADRVARAALARDGRFATQYYERQRLNDRQGMVEVIRTLPADAEGRLGPADAGTLVLAALAGPTKEVRVAALQAIESFSDDAITLLTFADHLSPDRRDARISQAIMKMTNTTLPEPDAPDWYRQARLALLNAVVDARLGMAFDSARVVALTNLIADSYRARSEADASSAFRPGIDPATGSTPAFEAQRLYERWLRAARPMAPTDPTPAPLRDIERRAEARLALAHDPIGAFAASQLGVLELAAYVTAAERPEVREDILLILAEATEARARATSVFAQLIAVERALARIWKLRLEPLAKGAPS